MPVALRYAASRRRAASVAAARSQGEDEGCGDAGGAGAPLFLRRHGGAQRLGLDAALSPAVMRKGALPPPVSDRTGGSASGVPLKSE